MTELEIKNSETSPIRVDFIPGHSLGLTFAPGKKGPAQLGPYVWDRDLETDLERLSSHYGVDCLVTLIEQQEFQQLEIAGLRDAVRAHEMSSHWLPIPDGGTPPDQGAFLAMVRTVVSALLTGQRVVVHCRGGLGRAGMVAACALVAQEVPPDEAVRIVRESRPGAIETAAQEEYVRGFHALWERANHRNTGVD